VADAEWLKQHIRDLPDHPKSGVTFRDITPLLGHPEALGLAIDQLAAPFRDEPVGTPITKVVAVEARGFLFGAPVATALGVGFVPVRKPGKLPWATHSESYELEYGTDSLEIHQDAITSGERVLIVDDVLATGGTALATAALVERLGGEVAGFAFLIDLVFLAGRARLRDHRVHAVLEY
jgi:adenine phosphoribosyltransferase